MGSALIRKATFEVMNIGLHARPAALVVTCLQDLDCTVVFCKGSRVFDVGGQRVVVPDGEQADGKSILAMLTLGCERGCVVDVICQGPDAQRAINALRQLRDDGLMFAEVE